MKKRELVSYFSKKNEEIVKELDALRLEISKLKLNISAGREKNLKKAKNMRKKISQLETILKINKNSQEV